MGCTVYWPKNNSKSLKSICSTNYETDLRVKSLAFGVRVYAVACMMIGRYSAATHISPHDYYQFDDEEEAGYEEEDMRDYFVENENFETIPVRELCDPSLENWVHHVQNILPQVNLLYWCQVWPISFKEIGNNLVFTAKVKETTTNLKLCRPNCKLVIVNLHW